MVKSRPAGRSSGKLREPLNKVLKTYVEPAKRGDSIKPGVERSGTPGIVGEQREEPAKWATAVSSSKLQVLGYRTLRALVFFRLVNLGFRFAPPQALCFHPLRGFEKASSY